MKNFFVKAGRPSKEEKALAEKIQSILSQAEKDGNKELLSLAEAQGAVYNIDGLKKLYNIVSGKSNIKPNNNTMGKSNTTDNEEENPSSQSNSPGEEEVPFEETIDMQTESPLQQPVVERADEFEKFQKEHGMGEGGSGDGGGGGNEGEGEEDFEEPRETGGGEGGED